MTKQTKFILAILLPLLFNSYTTLLVIAQNNSPVFTIQELQDAGTAIEFFAESGANLAGAGMYAIGDINDDGRDDFFVSAYDGLGKAYLIYGRSEWSNVSLAEIPNSIIGEEVNGHFGGWFAKLGDINNDSIDDYAIAALGHKIYIYSETALLDLTQNEPASQSSWTSIISEDSSDFMGHGLSGVGDVNEDGYSDILISDEWNDDAGTNAGKVYLIYGRSTENWGKDVNVATIANVTFLGNSPGGQYAMDTTELPDINGDNIPDFAMSSSSSNGRITIYFGGSNWGATVQKTDANVTINLEPHSGNVAKHIDGLGDINGDGYSDIIYGSWADVDSTLPTDYQNGKVYIIFGRKTADWPAVIEKDEVDATLISAPKGTGYAAGSMKDMNGDGYDEVLIGDTQGSSADENHAFILQGRATEEWGLNMNLTEKAYMTITSGTPNNNGGFANQVKTMGDVDGDGLPEFAINKWRYNDLQGGLYLIHDLSNPRDITSSSDNNLSPDPSSSNGSGSDSSVSGLPIAASFVVMITLWKRQHKNKNT